MPRAHVATLKGSPYDSAPTSGLHDSALVIRRPATLQDQLSVVFTTVFVAKRHKLAIAASHTNDRELVPSATTLASRTSHVGAASPFNP